MWHYIVLNQVNLAINVVQKVTLDVTSVKNKYKLTFLLKNKKLL